MTTLSFPCLAITNQVELTRYTEHIYSNMCHVCNMHVSEDGNGDWFYRLIRSVASSVRVIRSGEMADGCREDPGRSVADRKGSIVRVLLLHE
jgi:hypothetical protein